MKREAFHVHRLHRQRVEHPRCRQCAAAGEAVCTGSDALGRVAPAKALAGFSATRAPVEPVPRISTMAKPLERHSYTEWYVSYAWGDDRTPEGRARELVVDNLCTAAVERGHRILRDKEVLGLGGNISAFMRRIGVGDRVFVILSDKYLRSPHCMFELSETWRTTRQEGPSLLKRVRVYTLGDADIWKPLSRMEYAAYWKRAHDEMEAYIRDNGGVQILGERDFAALKRMGGFYRDVGDILATLADIVQPRSFEDLTRYGFSDN